MKVLLLCTDAYGGHGGIALYNRDLAEALAAREDVEEVIVIPRVIRTAVTGVPAKVTFHAAAAKGPAHYLRALAKARAAKPDLVICGHMNLLPVACSLTRRPLLMIYGIEAWKHGSRLTNRLLHRACAIVSISEITRDRLNEELLQVWESTGTTIVFVTHSIYEAAFLGQKVLLLAARPGRVRELVPVTLPTPRRLAMRETPEFVALAGHLRRVLETC